MVTYSAAELLGKQPRPRVISRDPESSTPDKNRGERDGAMDYRQLRKQKSWTEMKMGKMTRIENQCQGVE